MEFFSDFLSWAWARHHNVLSWYIRPMFILPFIFFAYKRSWKGLCRHGHWTAYQHVLVPCTCNH